MLNIGRNVLQTYTENYNPRKRIWFNDTFYHNANVEECEIELLYIIRDTHKKSLAIEEKAVAECCKYSPPIFLLVVF